MKKPHIRKIKGTPYWVCEGALGTSPLSAYQRREEFVKVLRQLDEHGWVPKRSLWTRIREWLAQ